MSTIVQTTRYANRSQANLRTNLVMAGLSGAKFKSELYPGKTIDFPYQTPTRVQDYQFSTNATIDPFVQTSNTYSIDQTKIVTSNYERLQNLQGYDLSPEDQLADDAGYQLARNIDQFAISKAISRASTVVSAGTLAAGNVFETMTSINAQLTNKRARQGKRYVVLPPDLTAILANCDKANGFKMADEALKVGFVGKTSAGFDVYESQECPYSVTLTLAANPTAGDTFTLKGYTWTFVANGTAANPGEISLGTGGSALADTQAIVRNAINGTGTPGASTYIDLAQYDRYDLDGSQVTCGAFTNDAAVITAYGKIDAEGDFTSGSNVFGTESGQVLFGVEGKFDLTIQSAPQIELRYPEANTSINMLATSQWGGDTFVLDRPSFAALTFNT